MGTWTGHQLSNSTQAGKRAGPKTPCLASEPTETSPSLLPILRRSLAACSIALGLTAAVPAHADVVLGSGVTLLIHSSGTLTGAKSVLVSGARYDVDFVDGTCAVLFSGCNELADFQLQTLAAATLAAQALLAQVFLNFTDSGVNYTFDTAPQKTKGCTSSTFCIVHTPYLAAANVGVYSARNHSNESSNATVLSLASATTDYATVGTSTFAKWTPSAAAVPEPTSLALVALAGVLAGGMSRRGAPKCGAQG